MAVHQEKRVEVHRDGDFVQKRRIVESGPSTKMVFLSRLTKFIWFVVGITVVLIAFRFLLLAIGANPASGFAQIIYGLTAAIVAPFQFITSNVDYTGGVIEVASIFAVFVYPILGWAIIRLLWILFADSSRTRQETTVQYD